MPVVEMTPELIKRIEVLEAQYKHPSEFAAAMGVEGSIVRYWKLGKRNMSLTAYYLFEKLEKEKLPSKR